MSISDEFFIQKLPDSLSAQVQNVLSASKRNCGSRGGYMPGRSGLDVLIVSDESVTKTFQAT